MESKKPDYLVSSGLSVDSDGMASEVTIRVSAADVELPDGNMENPQILITISESQSCLILEGEMACELAVNLLVCAKSIGTASAKKMLSSILAEIKNIEDPILN